MNLRDLHYLVALADHKHFGRAAEASFVSQPTLSTQIKKLEEELGVTLVERTPRKVLLTEAGQQIVARAREVLNEIEQIKRIAHRDRDPEAGTLTLGIFPTLGPYLLPHVMGAIRERFPRLELLLVEEKTPELVQRLREGKLDAAILALPVHDDTLHAEFRWRIWKTNTCCCWKTVIACATRRWRSAGCPAPTKNTGSARPVSRPCARWWRPTWASRCCRCWRCNHRLRRRPMFT